MKPRVGACNTPRAKDDCLVAVAIEEVSKYFLH